jgi:3-oxoacyl-[acyl-carrier-protein] synthase-3
MNAACSGFVYALDIAAGYFARGAVEHVLIVAAEGMSRIIDWSDRETCVLFGDGAGAAVLKKGNSLLSSVIGAQGTHDPLYIPASRGKSPFDETTQEKMFLHMAGKDVFRFAVGAIVKNLEAAAEKAGISLAEIDWIVPHQANVRMLTSSANQLNLPIEKFLVNIQKYGNTSSASIPLILDEASRDGRLQPGQLVAMVAFGGGLTTGACVLKWK